jgi:hypothetical protein
MGTSFLATFIGALLSGFVYTKLLGVLVDPSNIHHAKICNLLNIPAESVAPHFIWYILAGHLIVGMLIILGYIKFFGGFKERSE